MVSKAWLILVLACGCFAADVGLWLWLGSDIPEDVKERFSRDEMVPGRRFVGGQACGEAEVFYDGEVLRWDAQRLCYRSSRQSVDLDVRYRPAGEHRAYSELEDAQKGCQFWNRGLEWEPYGCVSPWCKSVHFDLGGCGKR